MSLNPLAQVGAAFRPRSTTVISCENNLLGYRQWSPGKKVGLPQWEM